MALLLGDDYFSDGSSYNDAMGALWDEEHDYEDDSEEFVLEEELPHEDDEYLESDSYEYPYPTSSDDSWAALSSDEAIQKIIEKLPTYSSESSGDERNPPPPPLDPASDSDAGSFVEHMEESKTNDHNIAPSQLNEYDPILYLKAIELYNIYVVSHSDSDADADESVESLPLTPMPATPQGQAQQDPPYPDTPDGADRDPDDAKDTQPPQMQLNVPQPPTTTQTQSDETQTQSTALITPSQPTVVPVIAEAATSPATVGAAAEVQFEAKEDIMEIPRRPERHRGRDAPRKMTKTRIVIKKVKAKRAPKRFKEGMKVQIKNHMKYGGVVGIIRFVGVIEEQKMVGIEISDDSMTGESDGTYNDQRYFECRDGCQQAVFVTIQNVKKYVDKEKRKQSNEFKKKSRERRRYERNNAQMYGNIVDNLWQQRIDLVRTKNYRIVHKAGPREFGRIEYFGGDDEYTNALNDPTHWLAPRLRQPKGPKHKPKPKAGPREIGRKESYVGIEYNEEEEARKRAKRQQAIEERKKKKFELARKRKLQEGAITRADGSRRKGSGAVKIKGKNKTKGKGNSNKTKNESASRKNSKSKSKKNESRKNSKVADSEAKIKKDKKGNKKAKKKKLSGTAASKSSTSKSGKKENKASSRKSSDNAKKKKLSGTAASKSSTNKSGKKEGNKASSRKSSDNAKKKKKKNGSLKGKSSKAPVGK